MPSFSYQSLTQSGQPRTGVLTAVDRTDAIRQLMTRGETAMSLELAQTDGKSGSSQAGSASHRHVAAASGGAKSSSFLASLTARRTRPSLGRAEMAQLMRELA